MKFGILIGLVASASAVQLFGEGESATATTHCAYSEILRLCTYDEI